MMNGTLIESLIQTVEQVERQEFDNCPECCGWGEITFQDDSRQTCKECKGTGKVAL